MVNEVHINKTISLRFVKTLKTTGVQGRNQNLKEAPQNFTVVFSVADVTANGVIRRNQHHKEKKLELYSNHLF